MSVVPWATKRVADARKGPLLLCGVALMALLGATDVCAEHATATTKTSKPFDRSTRLPRSSWSARSPRRVERAHKMAIRGMIGTGNSF
jgi:hypothetical protein